jgi:hypothetical protein
LEPKKNNYNGVGGRRTGYASNSPSYRFLNTGAHGEPTTVLEERPHLYTFEPGRIFVQEIFSATLQEMDLRFSDPKAGLDGSPVGAARRMTEENFMKEMKWI